MTTWMVWNRRMQMNLMDVRDCDFRTRHLVDCGLNVTNGVPRFLTLFRNNSAFYPHSVRPPSATAT